MSRQFLRCLDTVTDSRAPYKPTLKIRRMQHIPIKSYLICRIAATLSISKRYKIEKLFLWNSHTPYSSV